MASYTAEAAIAATISLLHGDDVGINPSHFLLMLRDRFGYGIAHTSRIIKDSDVHPTPPPPEALLAPARYHVEPVPLVRITKNIWVRPENVDGVSIETDMDKNFVVRVQCGTMVHRTCCQREDVAIRMAEAVNRRLAGEPYVPIEAPPRNASSSDEPA